MNQEQRINLLTQLTAGLLASGHYTYLDEAGDVMVRTQDNGKNWTSHGASRRFENEAVIRAAQLLEEIEQEAAIMAEESASASP